MAITCCSTTNRLDQQTCTPQMDPSTLVLPATIPMGLFDSPVQAGLPKAPRHLALVLQGHRHWALSTDLPDKQMIAAAAARLLELMDFCAIRRLARVTIYLFPDDFCRLPPGNHPDLVGTLLRYVSAGAQNMRRNHVSLSVEGPMDGLDGLTQALLREVIRDTRFNVGMQLTVVINDPRRGVNVQNRGSFDSSSAPAHNGSMEPLIDAGTDPDFVVRTGGPLPMHRAMVWDTQTTALYFTDVPWPCFEAKRLREALDWFGNQERPVGVQLNS